MSGPIRVAHPTLQTLCLVTVGVLVLVAVTTVFLSATAIGASAEGDHHPVSDSTSVAALDSSEVAIQNETAIISTNTSFLVELESSGDAHWTVTERFNISTESQQSAFEDVASAFESSEANGSALGYDAFVEAGEHVDAEIDRETGVTAAERTSTIQGDVGELTLTFTWENFARTESNQLILDDVYGAEQETWISGLSENQTLTIKSPEGYGFADANVAIAGGELRWEGPVTFTNETLQATLIGNGGGDPTPGNGDDTGTGGDESGFMSSVGTFGALLGGVGLLAAVVLLVVLAVGRERLEAVVQQDSTRTEETVTPEERAENGSMATAGEQSGDEIDIELLSDEERVERLLEENGGRMKQASIVKETDWSNAKVSQLLSSMEEEGQINKLRIGRENLISFPDEDLTEIGDK